MITPYLIIRSCPEPGKCKHAIAKSCELERLLEDNLPSFAFPAKIKVAISTCPRCCTMPKVRDVGFVAAKGGWELYFGGNGGAHPRIADLIARGLIDGEAVKLAGRCLAVYCRDAKPKMRTSRFMNHFTLEQLLKHISENNP